MKLTHDEIKEFAKEAGIERAGNKGVDKLIAELAAAGHDGIELVEAQVETTVTAPTVSAEQERIKELEAKLAELEAAKPEPTLRDKVLQVKGRGISGERKLMGFTDTKGNTHRVHTCVEFIEERKAQGWFLIETAR